MQRTLCDSQGSLALWRQRLRRNCDRVTPNGDAK